MPLRMQRVEHVAVGAPVVCGRASRVGRLLRGDLVPAEREPHDPDPEVLERRHALGQRSRPVHEPGVVLDAEIGAVRGLGGRGDDQRKRHEDDGSDPPEHAETVAAMKGSARCPFRPAAFGNDVGVANAEADARIRTADPIITSDVLYQLSYVGAAPFYRGGPEAKNREKQEFKEC